MDLSHLSRVLAGADPVPVRVQGKGQLWKGQELWAVEVGQASGMGGLAGGRQGDGLQEFFNS